MFNFIKDKFKKIYDNFTSKVSSLFSNRQVDDDFLKELSSLLISADTGVKTTKNIIKQLSELVSDGTIKQSEEAKDVLEKILLSLIEAPADLEQNPRVVLMVGINGSGKTTFVGKYANKLKQEGKRVLIVAGDTFRAAATQQLQEWGNRIGVEVFIGKEQQDPASVIFDACKKFNEEQFDHIIIDTAGRLQTKVNLMSELQKIRKIINKQLPETDVSTWLTVDAMLGQNSLLQAELFHEATALDGVVVTKLDGSGKGGVLFSIVQQLGIPVVYITFGEQLEHVSEFDSKQYVHDLLYE